MSPPMSPSKASSPSSENETCSPGLIPNTDLLFNGQIYLLAYYSKEREVYCMHLIIADYSDYHCGFTSRYYLAMILLSSCTCLDAS